MEFDKEEYLKEVKEMTPVHDPVRGLLRAFLTGGTICAVSQGILMLFLQAGMEKKEAGTLNMLIFIAGGVILTGLGVYKKLVKFGGAGAIVPITGFANAISSEMIESKVEGQIFGIGCKAFTIAGPVILYGVLISFLLGVISLLL